MNREFGARLMDSLRLAKMRNGLLEIALNDRTKERDAALVRIEELKLAIRRMGDLLVSGCPECS